jgi:hypothetical protein
MYSRPFGGSLGSSRRVQTVGLIVCKKEPFWKFLPKRSKCAREFVEMIRRDGEPFVPQQVFREREFVALDRVGVLHVFGTLLSG